MIFFRLIIKIISIDLTYPDHLLLVLAVDTDSADKPVVEVPSENSPDLNV